MCMTWQKLSAALSVKAAMVNVFSMHIDVTAGTKLLALCSLNMLSKPDWEAVGAQ